MHKTCLQKIFKKQNKKTTTLLQHCNKNVTFMFKVLVVMLMHQNLYGESIAETQEYIYKVLKYLSDCFINSPQLYRCFFCI